MANEKRTYIFLAGILFGVLMLAPVALADNEINIEQSGDTFQLGVDQVGFDNQILMLDNNSYITASSLDMYLVQVNTSNTSLPNKIRFDEVSGTGNQMKLGQGVSWDVLNSDTNLDWSDDGDEGGGHEIDITMYGDYNQLAVQQTNQWNAADGHNFDLHLAGDHNEVQIKQQGKASKTTNLTIYNDYNDVYVRQKGTNQPHTANITLDGLYGTDLTLIQFGTSGTQSYTISVDCMTVGGCSTSVIQE
tara:strand:+ start:37926 stop:38666 length:741 start_codon:yes stop_codon:yes gene_type:complete